MPSDQFTLTLMWNGARSTRFPDHSLVEKEIEKEIRYHPGPRCGAPCARTPGDRSAPPPDGVNRFRWCGA
ncbi:hypothetical protein [Kitasatospora sp. NPDC087314]|uniref:hypothetical protein n=1 Tax=Kitasatospora sp. NPDC087314 TaxID=3364068 RepID=UPI0037F130B6